MKTISSKELSQHSNESDCWVAIHGLVYDLTQFLDLHPGGKKIILKEAGRDGSASFDMVHPPDIISSILTNDEIKGTFQPNTNTVVVDKMEAFNLVKRPSINGVLNTFDMEKVARHVLTSEAWCYYSSGADDEITLRENHLAFHRILFKPRILRNVKNLDLTTTMFGQKVDLPIYITATALGKLGHPEGEVILTKAAATRGIIQMIPTLASCSQKEMLDAALPNQPQWFQLYVNQDREICRKLVQYVESRGVKVLCITVDAPSLGKREKDMRKKFVNAAPDEHQESEKLDRSQGAGRAISSYIDPSLNWDDLKWFKTITKMKIVLKGVQCGEDAVLAYQAGCSGVVVSNHGGRQLDTCRSGIEILSEVIDALKKVGGREHMEVYVDGGFRRGSDIIKALALGANGVGIGRPFLYGMAAYGQAGVEKVIDILKEEMEMNMRLCGVKNIKEIGPDYVVNRGFGANPRDFLFENVYEPLSTISVESKL